MIGIDQLTNRKLDFVEDYPFVLQRGRNDCGIACIKMVCLYYSVKNYKNIIGKVLLDEKGLSIAKMSNILNKLGFANLPIKSAQNSIPSIANFPIIARIKNEIQQTNHYIVIYSRQKNVIIYADPNVGVKRIKIEEFILNFSGELILIKK